MALRALFVVRLLLLLLLALIPAFLQGAGKATVQDTKRLSPNGGVKVPSAY